MTIRNRSDLKALSEDGDTADASLFTDLIDSAVNLSDTTAQSMSSELKLPKLNATTEVSAAGHKFAASAVTMNLPTTAASNTSGAIPTSGGSLFPITVNGSVLYVLAFTSAF